MTSSLLKQEIHVLFFAQLREHLGTAELVLDCTHISSVTELIAYLINSRPEWEQYLTNSNMLIAVNQNYAARDARIAGGDEVAFFPPVTGG